ncbi:MAG TPA: hypothetical protein VI755_09050 [Anaerolineales bacterium]|nr:hypothetical protein [Anaerolineales bacterium]
MVSFYQQVLTLLTTPPGNLAYHLVLTFSIAGALPGAFNLWQASRLPQGRRMVIGLGLLLATQLALMVVAGLAQFLPISSALVPILDRAMTTFSLILLVWLWVFPDPLPLADFATALLSLLTLILAIVSTIWGTNLDSAVNYNGALTDIVWQVFALILAFTGGVLSLLRRPGSYETGLGMFALLFIGHLIHLLAPLPEGDFPGVVRLTQTAAFPLLLILPGRYQVYLSGARPDASFQSQETPFASLDPTLFQSFLVLATQSAPRELYQAITLTVSRALSADLCLLISPPNTKKHLTIHSGYILSRQEHLGSATFHSSLAPVLAESLHQGRPLHLPADSDIPDLIGLGKVLALSLTGPLLAAPITTPRGSTNLSLVLLSPYTDRIWSASDQNYLADIARSLSGVLQRAQEIRALKEQLSQARLHLQSLKSENERLSQSLRARPPAEKSTSVETERLQAELRLTLDEVSRLKDALAEAGQRAPTLEQTSPISRVPGE